MVMVILIDIMTLMVRIPWLLMAIIILILIVRELLIVLCIVMVIVNYDIFHIYTRIGTMVMTRLINIVLLMVKVTWLLMAIAIHILIVS